MKRQLVTSAALLLALTACGSQSPAPDETPSQSPSATATAAATPSATKSPTSTPTKSAAEEPTAAAETPDAAEQTSIPEAAPIQPAMPAAPAETLTPGEWCATNTPISSGGIQTCYGIEQGYIDPNTGAYLGDGELPNDQPVDPSDYPIQGPEVFDPQDQDTWSGIDPDTGENWAGIPGPTVDF